jgi:RHS repeat-associated protein
MKTIKSLLLSLVLVLGLASASTAQKSTTTITDSQGNITTQVFYGSHLYEVKVQGASGSTLTTVDMCYNGASFPCPVAAVTLPVSSKAVYTTTPGVSGVSEASVVYDAYGQATVTKSYDFGPTLMLETDITFCSLGTATIKNRPCDVLTKNGSGTTVGHSAMTYTGTGDLLTKHMYTSVGTFLSESFVHSSTGILTSSTGVNGQTITYTNGACNGIFQTAATYPIVGSSAMTWDCAGGVQKSITTVDGSTHTVAYSDPFWRPSTATDPLGNVTSYKYTPNTSKSLMTFGNSVVGSLITFDLQGRPYISQNQKSTGGNYDTRSQTYDSLGRPFTTSFPCFSGAGVPCGSSDLTVTYDAIGRALTATGAASGSISTVYASADETTTLNGGQSKQLEYDGLGRLKSVCEISSGLGSGSCGQRVGATGYLTSYTLDAVGRITSASQGAQTRTATYDFLGRTLTEVNPESGTVTNTYDTAGDCSGYSSPGDLVERVDAAGNTACYRYDALHRVTSVVYSGPNTTSNSYFVYDAATVNSVVMTGTVGRLAEAYTTAGGSGATKITDIGLSYDVTGVVTDVYESTPNSGGFYHVAATLYPNAVVHTLQMTPAVLPTFTYGLDGQGRVATVSASTGQNPVVNTTRNAAGSVQNVTYGSFDQDNYLYDGGTRLLSGYTMGVGSQTITGSLVYNGNGMLQSQTITDPINSGSTQACGYAYDGQLRITTANCGVVSQTFSYDQYGNITKAGSFSFQPTYSATTNRWTAIGVVTPTYDANGDLLTDGTSTYTYDAERRMISGPGVTAIVYDALGRMVEQTNGVAHQQMVYTTDQQKLALMNGQTLVRARLPLPAGAKAVYTNSGLAYYARSGFQGNVNIATTPGSSAFADLSYGPFGEPYANSGVPDYVPAFTGLNQDTVVGLYDSATRRYNPLQSRWTTPDSSGHSNMLDPQTFNRYSYVENRAMNTVDISGEADDDPVYAPGVDPANGPSDPFSDNSADHSLSFNADPFLYTGGGAIDPVGQAVLSNPIIGQAASSIDDIAAITLGGIAVIGAGPVLAAEGVITAAHTVALTTALPVAASIGCAELCTGMGADNSVGFLESMGVGFRGSGVRAAETELHHISGPLSDLSAAGQLTSQVESFVASPPPALTHPAEQFIEVYHGSIDNFSQIMSGGLEATPARLGSGTSYAYVTRNPFAAIQAQSARIRPWYDLNNNGVVTSRLPASVFYDYFYPYERNYAGFNSMFIDSGEKGTEILLQHPWQIRMFNQYIVKSK